MHGRSSFDAPPRGVLGSRHALLSRRGGQFRPIRTVPERISLRFSVDFLDAPRAPILPRPPFPSPPRFSRHDDYSLLGSKRRASESLFSPARY